MAMKLKNSGFSVLEARDGEEALATLRRDFVDTGRECALVILDQEMSPMDGPRCARIIKADPALAHIPLLGVTGTESPEAREAFQRAGLVNCLVKPVPPPMLVRVVNAAIAAAHPAASAAGDP